MIGPEIMPLISAREARLRWELFGVPSLADALAGFFVARPFSMVLTSMGVNGRGYVIAVGEGGCLVGLGVAELGEDSREGNIIERRM